MDSYVRMYAYPDGDNLMITCSDKIFKLSSIIETFTNGSTYTSICFNLEFRNFIPLSDYVDSLKFIVFFIDLLVVNGLLSNLECLWIWVNYYDDELLPVFDQIDRFIKSTPNIKNLECNINNIQHFGNNYDEINKNQVLALLNNFLDKQTTIDDIFIMMGELIDVNCLRLFKHIYLYLSIFDSDEIKLSDIEKIEIFFDNFINMLVHEQKIESLRLESLPADILSKIIDSIDSIESLKTFHMYGVFYENHMITNSIANMLANNNSITDTYIYIPSKYESIIEALISNKTLRKLWVYTTTDIRDAQSINSDTFARFLDALDKMLDENYTLISIIYMSDIDKLKPTISKSIEEKLARNLEIFNNSRFRSVKPLLTF